MCRRYLFFFLLLLLLHSVIFDRLKVYFCLYLVRDQKMLLLLLMMISLQITLTLFLHSSVVFISEVKRANCHHGSTWK